MNYLKKNSRYSIGVLVLSLALVQTAQAHLMPAQHGTLNFVDDGAYLVLSLPISAFVDLDDDKDGEVSMIEFNNHRAAIVESTLRKVTLSDEKGLRPLEGTMLSPELSHDSSSQSITQLTILGRFSLAGAEGQLHFESKLFGQSMEEHSLKMTVSNKSENRVEEMILTPEKSSAVLFVDPGESDMARKVAVSGHAAATH